MSQDASKTETQWSCRTSFCPAWVDREGKRCAFCERMHWVRLLDLLREYGFDRELAEFAVAWQRHSVEKREAERCQPR